MAVGGLYLSYKGGGWEALVVALSGTAGVVAMASLATARRRGIGACVIILLILCCAAGIWGLERSVQPWLDEPYGDDSSGVWIVRTLSWAIPFLVLFLAGHNLVIIPRKQRGKGVPTLFVALFHLAMRSPKRSPHPLNRRASHRVEGGAGVSRIFTRPLS
jgi:hypothetical protein